MSQTAIVYDYIETVACLSWVYDLVFEQKTTDMIFTLCKLYVYWYNYVDKHWILFLFEMIGYFIFSFNNCGPIRTV